MAKSEKRFKRELEREARDFDRSGKRLAREARISHVPVNYPDFPESTEDTSVMREGDLVAPEVPVPSRDEEIKDYMSGLAIDGPGAGLGTLGDLSGGMDDLDTENSNIHNVVSQMMENPRNAGAIKEMLDSMEAKRLEEERVRKMWSGPSPLTDVSYDEGL